MGVVVRSLFFLFTLCSHHSRKAPNTKKVRMKKEASAGDPELPTWPPWPWLTHRGEELLSTRPCLMFWGCDDDRATHGFSAKAAGPLGYVKRRVDQRSPWSLVFCSELCTTVSCRSSNMSKHTGPFPEHALIGNTVVPGRGKGQRHRRYSFTKLITCHHGVKSSLMRVISQCEVHQWNDSVFTEASWAQASAGRGRILMTGFLVSGSLLGTMVGDLWWVLLPLCF